MEVNLSEKVVSGLKEIQKNYDCIDEALRIIEDFVYEHDEGDMNPDDALVKMNALRNIRYLKNSLSCLYREMD